MRQFWLILLLLLTGKITGQYVRDANADSVNINFKIIFADTVRYNLYNNYHFSAWNIDALIQLDSLSELQLEKRSMLMDNKNIVVSLHVSFLEQKGLMNGWLIIQERESFSMPEGAVENYLEGLKPIFFHSWKYEYWVVPIR